MGERESSRRGRDIPVHHGSENWRVVGRLLADGVGAARWRCFRRWIGILKTPGTNRQR
ncbi:hypothetical protein LINPERHAP2_LOCUS20505 [Linum perenne]